MYHNARKLFEASSGPYFYLSKLEGASEAELWNEIFIWAQEQLGLPRGTIKACVLIENIISSFELEEILYALREHSLGLNCGIWDYCASIIAKFGNSYLYLSIYLLYLYYKKPHMQCEKTKHSCDDIGTRCHLLATIRTTTKMS